MKVVKWLIVFLITVSPFVTHNKAFSTNMDSLFCVWNDTNIHDTCRLKAIHKIAEEGLILLSNLDSAFYYAQLEYDFAEARGLKKQMAEALELKASLCNIARNHSSTLEYHQQALKIREEIADKKGIANSLRSIGICYMDQGDHSSAMEYFQQSLSICEEISDRNGYSYCLHTIGRYYDNQGSDNCLFFCDILVNL